MAFGKSHILITGGATRLGARLALGLRDSLPHSRVSIHHHQAAPPDGFPSFQADLANPLEAAALMERVFHEVGPVTTLILNASVFLETPLEGLSAINTRWSALFDLNLRSAVTLMEAFRAETHLHPSHSQSVIVITDSFSERGLKGYAPYAATKTGLIGLVKNFARDWAPEIRVNGLSPGALLFPEDFDPQKRARILDEVPLGEGKPEDLIPAVLFLIRATYMTGATLRVDGGLTHEFAARSIH